MYASTRKSRFMPLLLAAVLLVLATSACGFQGLALGNVNQTITVTIPERMLQVPNPDFTVGNHDIYVGPMGVWAFTSTSSSGGSHNFYEPLLDEVTRLELHDGYMRFVGTRSLKDGSQAPGSVDLYLGAEAGRLVAQVIAVDIPGIKIDDPLVVGINQEMKVEFSLAMETLGSDVLFKSVRVTEEALTMQVQVNVRF